jgi:hypothetical protein
MVSERQNIFFGPNQTFSETTKIISEVVLLKNWILECILNERLITWK